MKRYLAAKTGHEWWTVYEVSVAPPSAVAGYLGPDNARLNRRSAKRMARALNGPRFELDIEFQDKNDRHAHCA